MTSQIVLNKMFVKDQDPLRTYIVDPSFYNNVDTREFNTIQGAIDQAIIDNPTVSDIDNQSLVLVHPGTYTEQIHSIDGIHIVGVQSQDNRYSKGSILTNAGTSESTYPLRSTIDDEYRIFGMGIETTSGTGVIGKLTKTGIFGSCYFDGQWIENNLDTAHFMVFDDCDMRDHSWKVFNLTGSGLLGSRNIALKHSSIFRSAPVFSSDHVGDSCIRFEDGTSLTQSAFRIESGDWCLRALYSNIANGRAAHEGRSRIGGTGDIHISYCIMNSGLKFTGNPNSISMLNNSFCDGNETIPVDEEDITSDLTITDVEYSGNVQFNGICGCIQITNPEKSVGAGRKDRYHCIQCAIDSIPAGGSGTIRVWEDFTGLPELTLPNANTNIKIKGQKAYSLSFTGDIVEIGNDRILGFNDMVSLTGGNIELNGTNNELGFESCQYVNAYVTLTNGAFAILYKSSLFGAAGHPAVTIATVDPIVVIGYSRCQGAVGHPAVLFTATASSKLKAKYSTFIHGTKLGNNAIQNTSGNKVDVEIYSCGLNADWDAADIDNLIVQSNNTVDEKVTF